MNKNKGEIVLYQPDTSLKIEVKLVDDTVWLNRQQLAKLFDRDIKTIGKHINNALREELSGFSTVSKNATLQPVIANFATTASDGKTYQVEHYSLDMVLSIGYRVKSQRGIQFRQWSNTVLKEYMTRGIAIHKRLEHLEQHVVSTDNRLEKTEQKLDFFIEKTLPRKEGIFYEGQVFDAYAFVIDLIKSAKTRIVLIDNYLDETILTMLSQRGNGINATIYTETTPQSLQLALQKYNAQYPFIDIKNYKKNHDRFLIIDEEVYHIGASIKDLGKKLFAFSKMSIDVKELLGNF